MRNAAVTKANILNAAEEEFAQKGIYGARIDEIARRAGSNKRMIYEYFGNKEDLYLAVLKAAYDRLSEQEEIVLHEDTDCIRAVENIIRMYYRSSHESLNFIKLIMWENLNQARYLKRDAAFRDLKAPLLTSLHSVVARGKEQGVFRQDVDEKEVATLLINLSYSYFSNMYTMSYVMGIDFSAPEEIENRIQLTIQLVLQYLSGRTNPNQGEQP